MARDMRRLLLATAVLLACLSGTLFPMAAHAAPLAGARTTLAARNALEPPVIFIINRARRAHGLRPLRVSTNLDRAAVSHARSMGLRGYFAHESPDGTPADVRIRRYYDVTQSARWTVGEALLWRSPDVTPSQAVQMWLESPPHRRLLLHPAFREIGLAAIQAFGARAVFRGLDVTLIVADFGAR